ncbi:MAG: LytTR family DNA-binding domain-containing protein [Rikenellaceae bacterium]
MRCIAIDDEPMALTVIEQYASRLEGIELTTYSDPVVGIEQVRRTLPDLLFLDVEMGDVNGVELARKLPEGVSLIFTTAYAQFAIDGFELNAVDFLHKPFSFTRFKRAVEKVAQSREQHKILDEEQITIKVEYQSVNIALSAIQYVEAMDNYVKIYLHSSRPVLSQMSLKSLAEMLPDGRFFRVHKSFVVSRSAVASYTRSYIVMRYGDVKIPIGRTYLSEFFEWINK